MRANRTSLEKIERTEAANAGLLLNRYLKNCDKGEGKSENRNNLFDEAIAAVNNAKGIYEEAFGKWETYIEGLPATKSIRLHTDGRLVHGLGSQNVLEAGVTLHHLYGTPIIPGSSLKGVASNYCGLVWGNSDERFKEEGEYHKILFGDQEDAGHIIFHDAWILPGSLDTAGRSGLVRDIMTTHHKDYYSDKAAPTDFDSPVPISFLSVTGKFLVSVSCVSDDEIGEQWSEFALKLLTEALGSWGVGGKTSSGYGRFRIEKSKDEATSSGTVSSSVPLSHYNSGDQALFTRIKNSKKGKVRFQAEDGFKGNVASGPVPDVEIGQQVTLEVVSANVKDKHYSLKYPG